MQNNITNVTDASIEAEILKHPGIVLLDIWATWCGPCKALAPVIDEIAKNYAGEVKVAKMDSDANPASTERLSVRGLPTVMLFVDGVEKARVTGAVSKTRIAAMIDAALEA